MKYYDQLIVFLHLVTAVGIGLGVYYAWYDSAALLMFLAGWALISGLGVSVALHRVFTHKTHVLKPWLKYVLLILAALSCEGSSTLWCALHRGTHHPKADTSDDPQRPQLDKGWWWSLHKWKSEAAPSISLRAVPDLLRDTQHQFFHRHYVKIVLALWLVVLIIDVKLFVFGVMIPTVASVWSNNLENVLSHIRRLGYRNFDTNDNSTNVWWMTFFGWGACALHNNHHANASRYNFAVKWWEFDPSMIFIPLLKLGSRKKNDIQHSLG